jgi:hypothetical protein
MITYNTDSYRLSQLPQETFKEKFPIGNGIITVHEFKTFNTHPSLFDKIKGFLGFDIETRKYRVTLWFEDKIAQFTDVDPIIWEGHDIEFKRSVINRLFKATEKEV